LPEPHVLQGFDALAGNSQSREDNDLPSL
jgi:hypothetical protein